MAPSHQDGPVEAKLRVLGFDPAEDVHEIHDCGLTVADIQAALFEHRWDKPRLLVIGEQGEENRLSFVVETVTVVWDRALSLDTETPNLGYLLTPSYYVTGKPPGMPDPTEVRAFFWMSDEQGRLRSAYVQVATADEAEDRPEPFRVISS
jgi:hypothetical protein